MSRFGKAMEKLGMGKEVPEQPVSTANQASTNSDGDSAVANVDETVAGLDQILQDIGTDIKVSPKKKPTSIQPPATSTQPQVDPNLYKRVVEILDKKLPEPYRVFIQQMDALEKVAGLSEATKIQAAAATAHVSLSDLNRALSERLATLQTYHGNLKVQIQQKIENTVGNEERKVQEIQSQIEAKKKEIERLDQQASRLNDQIESERKKLDSFSTNLQAVVDKISDEISEEQQKIQENLK